MLNTNTMTLLKIQILVGKFNTVAVFNVMHSDGTINEGI